METHCAAFLAIVCLVSSLANAANITAEQHAAVRDLVEYTIKQLMVDITSHEDNVNLMQTRFVERLNVIDSNKQFAERQLLESNEQLDRLAAFSSFNKNCVDKNRNQIATIATVQSQVATCISTAQATGRDLIVYSSGQIAAAKTELLTHLRNDYALCFKTHNIFYNLTNCNDLSINKHSANVKYYLKNVDNDMDVKLCASTTYTKHSQRCTFEVLSKALRQIGTTAQIIDNCITGRDEPLPCIWPSNNTVVN